MSINVFFCVDSGARVKNCVCLFVFVTANAYLGTKTSNVAAGIYLGGSLERHVTDMV